MKIKRTATAYVCMNPHQCTACWKCIKNCPRKVIGKTGFLWHRHAIFKNPDACIGCCKCIKTCPNSMFFKTNATTPTRRIHASVHMERLLPIAFIASAITGFGLHTAAGHDTSHENWQMWSVAHTIASLLWLLSATTHIKRHKLWYKDIASKGISHKRWITFFLSLLFLMTVCTGIVLITYVTGANSSLGLMHYKLGLLLLTFSLIHILCRK